MNRKWARSAWTLLGLGLAGLGVSLYLLSVHRAIAAAQGAGYTGFCNINETVNCEVVLSSRYAYLFGYPVAGWAALAYLGLLGLAAAMLRVSRFSTRRRLAQLTFGFVAWNAIFSYYMAAVALFSIGAICILCTSLYVINTAALPAGWMLYAGVEAEGRKRGSASPDLARRNRLVIGGSVAVLVAILALAAYEGRRGGAQTLDEIRRANPDFYRWYTSQPIEQVPAVGRDLGGPDAAVTIIEFSDFECGHCAAAHRVLQEVLPRYRGEVRVVFRNYPLDKSCNPLLTTQLHDYACEAAVAAECAGEQGKFWPYHDLLFENQSDLSPENLRRFARQLKLDMDAFQSCLGSEKAHERVKQDVEEGNRLRIESTPTMFINGRVIHGSLDADLLRYAIAIERAKLQSLRENRDRDAVARAFPRRPAARVERRASA